MTQDDRITELEKRLAQTEARIAQMEIRQEPVRFVPIPQPYPIYPPVPHWQRPFTTCNTNVSALGATRKYLASDSGASI